MRNARASFGSFGSFLARLLSTIIIRLSLAQHFPGRRELSRAVAIVRFAISRSSFEGVI